MIDAAVRAVTSLGDRLAGSRLSILIFHRVLPQPDPIFPGEMYASRFDGLCGFLARNFRVLGFSQALRLRREGRLPNRAVVITFDDGYADNAEFAMPLLRRHGLTATFFVASGFLDGGRMWNDTVVESIRRSSCDSLDLDCLGLHSISLRSLVDRRQAIDLVLTRVKHETFECRASMVEQVWTACDSPILPNDLMMSTHQLRALHAAGMEIGGHTVNHPILATLSDADARREIQQCRQTLQGLIGASVDTFAYPNGRPTADYERRHVDMVAEAGFTGAVTTAAGVAGAESNHFELPRYTPWNRTELAWALRFVAARLRSPDPRSVLQVPS
jgi:peptidoglycan/xylan/chitin deacetylase (PgdA/CDA1 family)